MPPRPSLKNGSHDRQGQRLKQCKRKVFSLSYPYILTNKGKQFFGLEFGGKSKARSFSHFFLKNSFVFIDLFIEMVSQCVRDLDKPNLVVMVVRFYAQANFCYCHAAASKVTLALKVVKSDLKIIISLY